MDTNEKLKKERLLILQTFAEAYLKKHNLPPSKIIYKCEDKFGELNDQQATLLHYYLVDEYKKMGKDLNEAIKASGEEVSKDKISNFEVKELIARADEMIVFLGVLFERKAALLQKVNKNS